MSRRHLGLRRLLGHAAIPDRERYEGWRDSAEEAIAARADLRQLRLQPALELVEARGGAGAADGYAALGRLAAGLLLDGVDGGDPFQRLGGDRRALGGVDVEELSSHMRQAGDLADRAGADQRAEPGIAV